MLLSRLRILSRYRKYGCFYSYVKKVFDVRQLLITLNYTRCLTIYLLVYHFTVFLLIRERAKEWQQRSNKKKNFFVENGRIRIFFLFNLLEFLLRYKLWLIYFWQIIRILIFSRIIISIRILVILTRILVDNFDSSIQKILIRPFSIKITI